jgi:hypothetical protein
MADLSGAFTIEQNSQNRAFVSNPFRPDLCDKESLVEVSGHYGAKCRTPIREAATTAGNTTTARSTTAGDTSTG